MPSIITQNNELVNDKKVCFVQCSHKMSWPIYQHFKKFCPSETINLV